MSRLELRPHPDTPAVAVERIHVEVTRLADGGLDLTFRIEGDLAALCLPASGPGARRDGLWRHTCCEAFVMAGGGPGYREFNFAPSGDWQAYAFTAYRADDVLGPVTPPRIKVARDARRFILRAALAPDALPGGHARRLGLSTVIETRDGGLAYWALRHAPGKPDFHQPDTFALELA